MQASSRENALRAGKQQPHLEPDGALGAEDVEGAGDKADDDGAPGLNGGGPRCDGDQAGQGAVAHDAHVVHMLACSATIMLSAP